MTTFMITHRKVVYHVNQDVVEYWIHNSISGWALSSKLDRESWPSGSYSYIELRHNMGRDKNGVYGPYIIEGNDL